MIKNEIKTVKHEPSEFATAFAQLYSKIIPDLYDVKSQTFLEGVEEGLKNIRRMKHFILSLDKQFFVVLKYQLSELRCAYMYLYSVLHTSVAYREFTKHLQSNENTFLTYSSSKVLKICCLGSGPGFEAIGIIKAIHDVMWNSDSEAENSTIDVHIVVVDICPEWKSEVFAIVNSDVLRNLFPGRRINFYPSFFEADLLKPFEENLRSVIENSNIVTIYRFMQENSLTGYIPKLRRMVRRTVSCIAEGSCLFMLNSAGGNVIYQTAEVLSNVQNDFKHQMITHKGYRLHPQTLKEMADVMKFRSFSNDFTLFPTNLTKVSSCIWVKKNALPIQEKFKTRNEMKEKTKKEKKDNSTKEEKETKKEFKMTKLEKKKKTREEDLGRKEMRKIKQQYL